MAVADDVVVFGLTGAFGSGCTTMADALHDKLEFHKIKISDLITEAWRDANEAEGQRGLLLPPRGALQDLGDHFRRVTTHSYWVRKAVEEAEQDDIDVHNLVLDGIRNPGEIEWLRDRFKEFFLIAIDAPPDMRWLRLQKTDAWKSRSRQEFDEVSARDIEAPEDWGQRVQQCVDLADYVITNDENLELPKARSVLFDRAQDLLKLAKGPSRRPSPDELYMQLAYSSAMASACLKRNVGAVIVEPDATRTVSVKSTLQKSGSPVGIGYNENPDWMEPCFVKYEACYRDLYRQDEFHALNPLVCPKCGTALKNLLWPYKCPNTDCGVSLLAVFFPDRAMTHCTAIHAEVRAIRSATTTDLSGCTLYATTFPCFLCAEEIIQAGINRLVYVEPYPDRRAEELLESHGVVVVRFGGVKSQAFNRFFGKWRAHAEEQYALPTGNTPTE